MSKMLAEIRRIVKEDVSNRITQYDVLYEAITNAIQANATSITCVFQSNDPVLEDNENNQILGKKKVDGMIVSDNGDGFIDINYESFCKYRTEHKRALGCKGVGRFIFLKVYKDIIYKSQVVSDQSEINFTFNFEFDTENIKIKDKNVASNCTEIKFHTINEQYLNSAKYVDRRILLDLEVIKEKVLIHLIPTLFFYKKEGRRFTIQFQEIGLTDVCEITENDIPDFNEEIFYVEGRDGEHQEFKLHYVLNALPGKLNAFYCADNRVVEEFSDQQLKISLPYEYSGYFLLEGAYLNEHVDLERNGFQIYPVRTDMFSTLSWEMINEQLKDVISHLIKQIIPDTVSLNKEKIQELEHERPYLIEYIEEKDMDMAGFLDKQSIIEKAKKRFDIAKEKLLANSGKSEYSDAELQEAIQITQNELVSYINDRVIVLERLQKLVDKKERVEEIIHNLFMEKGTTDNYFSLGKNNLWLLDDRFTSYSYAASDKRIKEVLESIGETDEGVDNLGDEPDLSLFFSHNPNNKGSLKSVLVELKSFDYPSKSHRKKKQGIDQLLDYIEAFKDKEKIEEVYAFLITDIDEKFSETLIRDNFIPLFSTDSPIYHRFYDKLGVSVYVVSAKTLIKDAEARNRVFLDIIRKQSRLNAMLNGNKNEEMIYTETNTSAPNDNAPF